MDVTVRKSEIVSVKLRDGTDITDQIKVSAIGMPKIKLNQTYMHPTITLRCDNINLLTDED